MSTNLVINPPRNPDEPAQVIFNFLSSDRFPSIAKQFFDIDQASQANAPDIAIPLADLPRIRVNGKEYIKESLLARKRGRTSWVSDHGYGLVEWPSLKKFWACKACDDHSTILRVQCPLGLLRVEVLWFW